MLVFQPWQGRNTLLAPPCSVGATKTKFKINKEENSSEAPRPPGLAGWRSSTALGTWVVRFVSLSLLLLGPVSVVIPGVPVRVELHVPLPLYASLLIILSLLLAGQTMPLEIVTIHV